MSVGVMLLENVVFSQLILDAYEFEASLMAMQILINKTMLK
jgi:hypothetical protein